MSSLVEIKCNLFLFGLCVLEQRPPNWQTLFRNICGTCENEAGVAATSSKCKTAVHIWGQPNLAIREESCTVTAWCNFEWAASVYQTHKIKNKAYQMIYFFFKFHLFSPGPIKKHLIKKNCDTIWVRQPWLLWNRKLSRKKAPIS